MFHVNWLFKRNTIVFLCVVFFSSLLLRLYPVKSESFQYDAVVSQVAASKGFIANALDADGAFAMRRWHPPLLSYVIIINNKIFGTDEFQKRLFSIIAGALCCVVVFISVSIFLKDFKHGDILALLAGLMLCFLPVHLYVSRTSNWDAVYSLLAACSLLGLSLYVAEDGLRNLLLAGISAALAFMTCEIGLFLVPPFIAALLIRYFDGRHGKPVKDWFMVAGIVILLALMIWPAGFMKLDLFRMMRFRIYDSIYLKRNAPWYVFYTGLFTQAPTFSIFAAFGMLGFLSFLFLKIWGDVVLEERVSQVLRSLVPFFAYVLVCFAASLKNRLVYVHHIVDMMPPVSVMSGVMLGVSLPYIRGFLRKVIWISLIVLLAFSIKAGLVKDPEVTGPQEHPGYLGIRDYFRDRLDSKVFYYYADIMDYYLPGNNFTGEGLRPRWWTREKVRAVLDGNFDYVVSDWSMFSEEYPDIDSLVKAFAGKYMLVHVVHHRRTGSPVAWIFSRKEVSGEREVYNRGNSG